MSVNFKKQYRLCFSRFELNFIKQSYLIYRAACGLQRSVRHQCSMSRVVSRRGSCQSVAVTWVESLNEADNLKRVKPRQLVSVCVLCSWKGMQVFRPWVMREPRVPGILQLLLVLHALVEFAREQVGTSLVWCHRRTSHDTITIFCQVHKYTAR